MDETTPLIENQKPTESLRELEILLDQLWSDQHDRDVFAHISARLKDIEGAVTRKYASFSPKVQRRYRAGDFAETLEIVRELSGWQWLWRFPSLLLTVLIASACIPLAETLDEVIVNHPILGGFPPAISAAAGCIGIQNTAIIIRALGLKLTTPGIKPFLRFTGISFSLSLVAAIIEGVIAWVVLYIHRPEEQEPWLLIINDVPIVIFTAMVITGTLAGMIGAGIPLLVIWLSNNFHKNFDPAHWVGPIETVSQEFCAAFLTFYLADAIIYTPER